MDDDVPVAFKSRASRIRGDQESMELRLKLRLDASFATRWLIGDGIGRNKMKKQLRSTKQNARVERI
jgi:hypothetical protein